MLTKPWYRPACQISNRSFYEDGEGSGVGFDEGLNRKREKKYEIGKRISGVPGAAEWGPERKLLGGGWSKGLGYGGNEIFVTKI